MNKIRQEFNEDKRSRKRILELSTTEMLRVKHILEFVGSKKKVLDIGCGDGLIAKLILKNDNEVYGSDISESALEIACTKGIKTHKIDLESDELPFPENFFDVVVAGEVIEHIFFTDKFLLMLKHSLKAEGDLIITTPNLASLGRRVLLLLGKNPLIEVSADAEIAPHISYQLGASGHIRYFVKQALLELLKAHEFIPDKFTTDTINFNGSGSISSVILGKMFPTLGRTLIVRAKNIK